MRDEACVELLRWALPKLSLRWRGFRRVRRQVCKRIERRRRALGLADAAAYRAYLEDHPDEWPVLDAMCRITISRFWRDRAVFDALANDVLPSLARRTGRPSLRVISIGCASGEEPYSVVLAWHLCARRLAPRLPLEVVAIDADARLLERARRARYAPATLRELPPAWIERAFLDVDQERVLRDELRAQVRFELGDARRELPPGPFDLVLCRNFAFTYLDAASQEAFLARLLERLAPGGALVVGSHEAPPATAALEPWPQARHVYRRS